MNERLDIYKLKDPYMAELQRMNSAKISQRNKELIKGYHQFKFAEGKARNKRISKIGMELRLICEYLQKDLDKLSIKDIEQFLSYINQRKDISEATKSDYISILKAFFGWFEDEDCRQNSKDENERTEAIKFYKYINRKVKANRKTKSLDYSGIITDEDCRHLIKNCSNNILEEALISMLHETGFRAGEILNIRIKDIEIQENLGIVLVDGKTGQRRVPFSQSLPYILHWLEKHPDRENKDAFLWVSMHNGSYNKPIHWIGLKKMLKRTFKRAGLKKKANPHWFRHSRATINAPKYSEQVLCGMMGWQQGSKMIRTYVHLGAKQIEDAFKQNNGLMQKEKEIKSPNTNCVCGNINNLGSRYCWKCGKALSVGVILEDQEKVKTETNKTIQFLMEIMKDPELMKRFEEFKQTTK